MLFDLALISTFKDYLQCIRIGLFPVLLWTFETSWMTSMMALRLEHEPPGDQQVTWKWVTLWDTSLCIKKKYMHTHLKESFSVVFQLDWLWYCVLSTSWYWNQHSPLSPLAPPQTLHSTQYWSPQDSTQQTPACAEIENQLWPTVNPLCNGHLWRSRLKPSAGVNEWKYGTPIHCTKKAFQVH